MLKMNQKKSVLHITETYSHNAGGLTSALDQLIALTQNDGWSNSILSVGGESKEPPEGIELIDLTLGRGSCRSWLWTPSLSSTISTIFAQRRPDIVHLHGCWMAPQWFGARLAAQLSIPVVLTLHNMLDPWLWDNQGWGRKAKKSIYWNLVASPVFKSVQVIHAITPREQIRLKEFFPSGRIEVIPNSIEMGGLVTTGEVCAERRVMFLGRLHPVKGVDLLLRAFAAAVKADWILTIIGPIEDSSYIEELKLLSRNLGIEERVEWIGPLYTEEKYEAIRRAWVVVVPSFSEVIGMVNLESAACGVPTITTFQTGLLDWEEGGGLLCHPNVESLSIALTQACAWAKDERMARGILARRFVSEKYSSLVVKEKWSSVYGGLLRKG